MLISCLIEFHLCYTALHGLVFTYPVKYNFSLCRQPIQFRCKTVFYFYYFFSLLCWWQRPFCVAFDFNYVVFSSCINSLYVFSMSYDEVENIHLQRINSRVLTKRPRFYDWAVCVLLLPLLLVSLNAFCCVFVIVVHHNLHRPLMT